MTLKKTYYVIGVMSGSSLDGLDIVYCKITTGKKYAFEIIYGETIKFSLKILSLLKNLNKPALNSVLELDVKLGIFIGDCVNRFIKKYKIKKTDIVASHGHTVSHHPEKKFTFQIGDGYQISNKTNCTVVYDFRKADIAAGGQGAPLVPVCDELFFNQYHACLNIGGIANISYKENNKRIGFDICAANQLLNALANELKLPFDKNGNTASKSKINYTLLGLLNSFPFFRKQYPKSLDNNFIQETFLKTLFDFNESVQNKLATATEHIAMQIATVILSHSKKINIASEKYKLLVTGGGTYNAYLIKRIETLAAIHCMHPGKKLVEFKEALAMCVMGILRLQHVPNFLPSVTGAKYAVCGGVVIHHQAEKI